MSIGIADFVVPLFVVFVILFGYLRRVSIFEVFVEGAKEGLHVAIDIFPYLAGMMVAIAIFRQSGAFDLLASVLAPITQWAKIPSDFVPIALMRSISGNATMAMVMDVMRQEGPDSFSGTLAAVMMGASETTLYVLTVYFGSVGIRKWRYALPVGLIADAAAALGALYATTLFFGK
ncbi:MAG: spore maturation protein [Firmicutes bacterium]|nr:spore maturation protein [Bacillota bacterium]